MRRRLGDPGIAQRRIEALLGEGGIVVGVNQIVRHARMLRPALGDRLQDGSRLELVGVGLVRRRRSDVEREGIVDLHFVVIGIAAC